MATNIPQDEFQKTALRLPKDLHAALHEAASAAGRSYNAEIISRLQASFKAPMDLKREQLKLFIDQAIDERVELLAQMQSPASKAIDVLVRGKRKVVDIPGTDAVAPALADEPKAATPRKMTVLVGNIGRLPPAEKPAAKVKTPAQRLRKVATKPIRQNNSKKGL